jgi:YidC/Oxa1 family membrane protein insertase
MSPTEQKSKVSTIEFIATFLILFFLTNALLKYFFPKQFGGANQPAPTVVLQMEASKVRVGNDPVVIIKNDTDKDLPLPKRCPQPPVDIAYLETKPDGTEERADLMANQAVLPCIELENVKAGQNARVDLAGWKYTLFERTGTYEAGLDLPESFAKSSTGTHLSARFQIVEPGFFTKVFRTFVTRPLLNALVFIASYVPGANLGVAILLLTILVKLILLIPSQHALEGQKKLQQVQPKMEELKKKYPNDPKRVQEETMKLWKEMKINPLQSCLPTFLQLPILLGLFFVIKSGVSIETSRHLLYPFYIDHPQVIGSMFLGFDLLKPSVFVFPPLLVLLQFFQMKMMMKKTKKQGEIVVKPAGRKFRFPELDQQTIMLYTLPLMIGFFALKFPAAVSLYWGISTLFGIVQQWFVMRKK